ncbi:hypothetical protein ABIC30_000894 [Methylobacterium sp. 1030]
MRRYGMRGTPTTIVIDRDGRVREHAFGQVDDLALGILVGSLIAAPVTGSVRGELVPDGCDEAGCRLTEEARP